MALSRLLPRSPRRLPRPARPRVPGQSAPPPAARDVLLSAIVRIGGGLAHAGDDGGGLAPDACAAMAAELRVVWRVLRSLRLASG